MAKSLKFCAYDLVTCLIAFLIMKLFQIIEITNNIDNQLVWFVVFLIGWIGTRIYVAKRIDQQNKEAGSELRARGLIVIKCPICNQSNILKENETLKCKYCNQYLG
jgi:hypothetical protein